MIDTLFPKFTVWGFGQYLLFAFGLVVGVALFETPAKRIEGLIAGLKN